MPARDGPQDGSATAPSTTVPSNTQASAAEQPITGNDGANVDDMDEEAYLKFLAEAYGGADQQELLDKFEQDKKLSYQDNGFLGVD